MGEHKRNPMANTPKAHQITEINITMKNGMTVNSYTIHTKADLEDRYRAAYLNKGIIKIESGADSEKYANNMMLIPADDVMIFAVAEVKQPSNIIKPSTNLSLS